MLSVLEFLFGGLEFLQTLFPLRFEPACNQTIVRIDRAITTFSTLCTVTGALDVTLELRQGRFVICFDLFGGCD